MHCFGGCPTENVLGRLELEMKDLYASRKPSSVNSQPKRITAVYPYEDEDGRPLAEKVRFEPKGFAWQRSKK